MDNVGPKPSTPTNHYYLDPKGNYTDWWITFPASSTNPFTWSQHYILFDNDPGIHVYFVLDHGPGDIAGSIGQIQWVFRGDLSQFVNTYSVNTGPSDLGATDVPLPDAVLHGVTESGRSFSFNHVNISAKTAGRITDAENWRFRNTEIHTADGSGVELQDCQNMSGLGSN